MQRAMDRLSDFLERRGRWVLGVWVVLLLAAIPFAARQTEHLTSGGFTVPSSESASVDRAIHNFEGAQRDPLAVVVGNRGGGPTAVRAEIDRAVRAADKTDHADIAPAVAARAKREAGREPITIVPVRLNGTSDQNADAASELRRELHVGKGAHDGVEPYLVGQQALWAGMQDLSKHDLEKAEFTGFPIVLLILLAVFGSLVAATLPLVLGFVSVGLTGAGIYFLSQATEMSVFVTNVASMIGIGVAVDYSLFVLARYREEVRAGRSPRDARRVALRTSGLAVAFSGITVMLSLGGLFLVDSTTIRSMAMGAIIVVAVSILGAVTLLPVLMHFFGKRGYSPGRIALALGRVARAWRNLPRRRGSTHPDASPRRDFWQRWTDRVTRRPVVSVVASAAVLLVLAIPALWLTWGDGALRQFPTSDATRVGAELAAKRTGAGAAGPTEVLARFDHGTLASASNSAAVRGFRDTVARDPAVASVGPARASRDGSAALVQVVPRSDPESPQARALVSRLRSDSGPSAALQRTGSVAVGGTTAHVEDFKNLVSGSMWKILLFVAVFSYLVLFLLLRSVFLPLKAVLVNLLSVAAAYGVLVAVFQWGWFDSLLGFHHLGYINTMTPPFLLAIVFGLSMDYEVFLLTRIRERYNATGDNRRAVSEGLRASARTISSAALIMVAVFAVFAGTGVPSIKEIGLGLAVAIALDATLVRLVLVPAAMELMGRWNWWLPRSLERRLPHTEFDAPVEAPARA